MKCNQCQWDYPDELLNNMFIDGGYTKSICGICALELSNEITGVVRERFQGEMAEALRQKALVFKNGNISKRPK